VNDERGANYFAGTLAQKGRDTKPDRNRHRATSGEKEPGKMRVKGETSKKVERVITEWGGKERKRGGSSQGNIQGNSWKKNR